MPRNIYDPNKTPDQRRQQNERAMRLLEKWASEPELIADYAAVEGEFEVASGEFLEKSGHPTREQHVPLA